MDRNFLDKMRERCSLMLLNIGYEELNANWNWKNIYSPFARIYYVVSGEAWTEIEGRRYRLLPGNMYLTPPFTLHHDSCDGEFSLYYIHLYERSGSTISIFDQLDIPVAYNATDFDLKLIQHLLKANPNVALQAIDPEIYDTVNSFSSFIAHQEKLSVDELLENEGVLLQLLSRFLKNAKYKGDARDQRLTNVLNYIYQNITQELKLSDLAEVSCVSEDHLIRLFKKELNITPMKYVNEKKMERAQLLLLTTGQSVKEIAQELSIFNISYFNRLFKKTVGMSPSQYRMANKF